MKTPRAKKGPKPRGYVVYEGPSRIDRKPIVVIATGFASASQNAKTGAMIQTWILRADVDPVEALRTGADVSICGGCPHRPKELVTDKKGNRKYKGRTCYVNIGNAPLKVYQSWKRGIYPVIGKNESPEVFENRVVRLGSYGDPAAVPVDVWEAVTSKTTTWTGYTHQWKSARLRDVTKFCQASADNTEDLAKARSLGLGTFRVRSASEALEAGEIICPAGAEAGKKTVCADCRMCDGSGKNIAIIAHGIGAKMFEKRVRLSLPVITN